MIYIPKHDWQPICAGLDVSGELIWDRRMKEPWHLKMFPVQYQGDLGEQWMRLIMTERGYDWRDKP